MRLLLDQGLPRSAARFLRDAGIDTVHVGEIGYFTADDATILQKGRDDGRTVVTLDADFHALLAISRATCPSVIRLRIEGLYGEAAAHLIQAVLAATKTWSKGRWLQCSQGGFEFADCRYYHEQIQRPLRES